MKMIKIKLENDQFILIFSVSALISSILIYLSWGHSWISVIYFSIIFIASIIFIWYCITKIEKIDEKNS